MTYKHILVGVDGSEQANRAFEVAFSLAKNLGADLHVAWVINRDRGMDSSFGVSEDFYQDLAKQAHKKVIKYLDKAANKDEEVDVYADAIIGNVKTSLAKTLPEELETDLIVVGSTGANAVEKMLQGSHTSYIVGHAGCDVLVVK